MTEDKLEEALKVHEEYLEVAKSSQEDARSFDIGGKLEALGYPTIRDFLRHKSESYLQRGGMRIVKEISPDGIFTDTKAAIEGGGNALLFVKPEGICVYNGATGYNKDYTDKNNIPVYEIGYTGGTIVAGDKDVALIVVSDSHLDGELAMEVSRQILEYVGLSEDDVEFDGNDILVDGNKIFSHAMKSFGPREAVYFQISFGIDMEEIKNICTKNMQKVPVGMTGFKDKDRDGLVRHLKKWLHSTG